jgi:antitoxin component of RelBE/YafQ-DinJ toxin-antitoxin module
LTSCGATVAPQEVFNLQNNEQKDLLLEHMAAVADEAKEYAETFGLTHTEAAIYAVFRAMRNAKIPLGLKGEPFVVRRDDIIRALQVSDAPFDHFFTMQDFAKAVEDDFLDAVRGSTDNRKGWKV